MASYTDALAAVARALENLTRGGESFATGRHDRFPPPGLRLNGDKHELQQPLAPTHEQAIMRCASGSRARGRGKPTTWELASDQVEILNPKWDTFVDEIVDEIRAPMGIALDASIAAMLSKVVLHTQGGRFDEPSDDTEKASSKNKKHKKAFATLVVVLPGDFQGGDFVLPQRGQKPVPGPCFVYDVAYVAFYRGSAYRANPVTSGARLSLVYELSTKTITDVPQSAGATLLQGDVDAALAQYFGLTSKRPKKASGREASTSEANERFVYVVTSGGTFDELTGSDSSVAKSLTAFCRSTQGAFTLYLADVQCKRVTYRDYQDDDDAFGSDDDSADITLYLESPWLPFLDSDDYDGPTIELSDEDVIAPDELWARLKEEEWEIEHIGHNELSEKTQWHRTHALVVQATPRSSSMGSHTTKKRKASASVYQL